jgi:hypothetical protein
MTTPPTPSEAFHGDDRLPWLQEMAQELLGAEQHEPCPCCDQSHLAGGQGLAPDMAEFLLQAYNRKRCSPPLATSEVRRVVDNIAAAELQRLRTRAA